MPLYIAFDSCDCIVVRCRAHLDRRSNPLPTWNEVGKRDDLVGGQIEMTAGRFTRRVHLLGISPGQDGVVIQPAWAAIHQPSHVAGEPEWVVINVGSLTFLDGDEPTEQEDGGLRLAGDETDERTMVCTLYPRGHPSNIEPSMVRNLNLPEGEVA